MVDIALGVHFDIKIAGHKSKLSSNHDKNTLLKYRKNRVSTAL